MTDHLPRPDDVLAFWFDEIEAKMWWVQSAEFDQAIAARFGPLHAAATRCELFAWRQSAAGRLAEVIVLDQFSRNIHRGSAAAFASDALALALAQEAVAAGADLLLDIPRRTFLYMPWMHSESPAMHVIALRLFATPGMEYNLAFEQRHKDIVDRFGRYPHRNAMLGRVSTTAEIEFLKTPGSSF